MATRTIGTEIVLSGEKAFNDAMKSVNANLKNLRSDMSLVTAEFGDNAESMEGLTKKQKVLQESVEQHRAKVDALQRMYEKVKEKVGENSAAADKYRLELNNATAALIKEQKQLEKTTAAIDAQAEAAEDLTREQKKAGDSAEKAAIAQQRYADRMAAAERRADALKRGFEKLGTATLATSKAVAVGTAAIAAAGGVALMGMVNMAKEAAEAAKAAAEAGETLTPTQQRWLDFSRQLDSLDTSAASAKSALSSILLPALSDLSTRGGSYLDAFARDMDAAAGNTDAQSRILGQYIAEGASIILERLPDYISSGKAILSGIDQGLSENKEELLETGLDLLKDLLGSVFDNAPMFAEGGLELVLQLLTGIDGKELGEDGAKLVSRLAAAAAKASPEMIDLAGTLVTQFQLGLAENSGELIYSGGELVLNVVTGAVSKLPDVTDIGGDVIHTFADSIRAENGFLVDLGVSIMEWVLQGIMHTWFGFPELVKKFFGLFAGDVTPTVDASLLFPTVDSGAVNAIGPGRPNAFSIPGVEDLSLPSAKRVGSNVNVTINTTSLSRADLDMVTEYVDQKLGEDIR